MMSSRTIQKRMSGKADASGEQIWQRAISIWLAQSVQLISDDLKAELAELSKKIVAGEIEVETALG